MASPLKSQIKDDVEREVKHIAGVQAVEIAFNAKGRSSRGDATLLSSVRNVITVASGKGGVWGGSNGEM